MMGDEHMEQKSNPGQGTPESKQDLSRMQELARVLNDASRA